MEQIGRLTQLQQALKKWGDLRGLPQYHMATEVLPIVDLTALDAPPYHSKHGAILGSLVAASAGNLSLVGVANPASSTELWVLRSVKAALNALNGVRLMAGAAAAVNTLTAAPFRDWDNPSSSATLSGGGFIGNPAAVPGGTVDIGRFALAAQSSLELLGGPVVIHPDESVYLVTEAVNVPLWATFYLDRYSL